MSPVIVHRKYRAGMIVLFRERRWEVDSVEFWQSGDRLTLRALEAEARGGNVFEVWAHQVEFTGEIVGAGVAPHGASACEALA